MRGLGTDIVSVPRIGALIQRHGDRFLNRCFHPGEISSPKHEGNASVSHLAACWSAKEAFIKAVAPHATGVVYRDIEVIEADACRVELRLHGAAAKAMEQLGAERTHLSLAATDEQAVALVVVS